MKEVLKILICEDYESFANVLKDVIEYFLQKQKIEIRGEIRIVRSVKEARVFFTKDNPDLIICDGNLTDGNTYYFVKEIIETGFSKDRIMALVGSENARDALEVLLKSEAPDSCHCYLKDDVEVAIAGLEKMIENILIN